MFEYLPLEVLSKDTLIDIIHNKEDEIKKLRDIIDKLEKNVNIDYEFSVMSHMQNNY